MLVSLADEKWKQAIIDCYGPDALEPGYFSESEDDEPLPSPLHQSQSK